MPESPVSPAKYVVRGILPRVVICDKIGTGAF